MSKQQIEKKSPFVHRRFSPDIRGERRMRTNWLESFSVEIISLASLVSSSKKATRDSFLFGDTRSDLYGFQCCSFRAWKIHALVFFTPRCSNKIFAKQTKL